MSYAHSAQQEMLKRIKELDREAGDLRHRIRLRRNEADVMERDLDRVEAKRVAYEQAIVHLDAEIAAPV